VETVFNLTLQAQVESAKEDSRCYPQSKINLVMALLLSMLAVLGLTLNPGGAASATTLKGKLLRRYDNVKLKPDARELDLLRKHSAKNVPGRLVENKIPKHCR